MDNAYWLLVCHLVGDYCLQSHTMAQRKTTSWRWAAIHAFFYTLPFLFLTRDPVSLAIIGGTHGIIDRYRLASYWCRFWGVGFPGIWARKDGFVEPPPFLGVWLVIIVDNTMHLAINGAVILG